MSENIPEFAAALPPQPPARASRRNIAIAIGLGLVLLIAAAAIAITGIVTGLLVFNGCYGASNPVTEALSMLWIFALWPLSLAATAIIPPVLFALGRGARRALVAFILGGLASALIWLAFLPLGYIWFC